MTQSATHHWLHRSIAGRANYEVPKTVTDDHAVQIAQSATHRRMFVCDGLQHGPICQREENRKEFNCLKPKQLIIKDCARRFVLKLQAYTAIQTRSIAWPLRQQSFLLMIIGLSCFSTQFVDLAFVTYLGQLTMTLIAIFIQMVFCALRHRHFLTWADVRIYHDLKYIRPIGLLAFCFRRDDTFCFKETIRLLSGYLESQGFSLILRSKILVSLLNAVLQSNAHNVDK